MPHAFTFFRVGGFDQVRLATAADLAALGQLDRKLWAALACPVQGLEFDERTLALVDTDGDNRVRVPEVIAAVEWCARHLVDLGAIISGRPRLPLAAIKADTPAGQALLGCARRVLDKAGKASSPDIGLDEIGAVADKLAKTDFNGDGILPVAAAGSPALAAAITDILTTCQPAIDRSGEPGLDRERFDAFAKAASAWLAWWDAGRSEDAGLLPLGETTPVALTAVEAVRAKIDDFFLRCRAAAFDARSGPALARSEADWTALADKDLSQSQADIAAFPLARIAPGAELPLGEALNPAWSGAIDTLRRAAIEPLLGARTTLSLADWRELTARLERFRAWRAGEPAAVGTLGAARLRELLDAPVRDGLAKLFAKDAEVKPEFDALQDLERLVRYHRDLYRLLGNFVNLTDFYDPEGGAIFQVGTLFLDGRSSDLVVSVSDMARHGQLAGKANGYLVYCDCSRTGAKRTICAMMTNGDADGLAVGRNGLFIDRQGRDWDAVVVKVVEHPISIREAFWTPYKRVVRFVEDFVAKRAAEADKAADAKLSGVTTALIADPAKAGAVKPKIDVGTVAALGVALGGITTAIGLFLNALFGLGWWIPVGIIGLVLLISGPSMVLAWLKLRARTLGPLLDANGWAVNGRVRITIPLGTAMTRLAELPPGAVRQFGDPYAEKRTPWKTWLVLLAITVGALWSGLDRLRNPSWWWQRLVEPPAAVEPVK